MAQIPTRKPIERTTDMRSLVTANDNPEKPYPVYQFGPKKLFERPRHNPFKGL